MSFGIRVREAIFSELEVEAAVGSGTPIEGFTILYGETSESLFRSIKFGSDLSVTSDYDVLSPTYHAVDEAQLPIVVKCFAATNREAEKSVDEAVDFLIGLLQRNPDLSPAWQDVEVQAVTIPQRIFTTGFVGNDFVCECDITLVLRGIIHG